MVLREQFNIYRQDKEFKDRVHVSNFPKIVFFEQDKSYPTSSLDVDLMLTNAILHNTDGMASVVNLNSIEAKTLDKSFKLWKQLGAGKAVIWFAQKVKQKFLLVDVSQVFPCVETGVVMETNSIFGDMVSISTVLFGGVDMEILITSSVELNQVNVVPTVLLLVSNVLVHKDLVGAVEKIVLIVVMMVEVLEQAIVGISFQVISQSHQIL
ncbi:hypothetical protein BCR33DRAFT_741352 [Rhizoclosmatium globosum]|uniref:Uncharacterized protein n=1 Tax=Rhizoclosmatium globosum TaxID=329046 RepID=A0A1Y2BVR1_9FUNG|nr:hypothetical protein BCR33DRAFT_741352 [Rhizoclosmatium globosum]|eukprot:ORY38862.1 hypothetical protein BCR33DRAFT_741352 [Rhizoclosmatium globosum]